MPAAPALQHDGPVLIPGQRNAKLADSGHLYTKHKVYRDRIVWRCDTRRKTKCAGSVVVAGESPHMTVLSSTPHSCRPKPDAVAALTVHAEVLQNQKDSSPSKPYGDVVGEVLSAKNSSELERLPSARRMERKLCQRKAYLTVKQKKALTNKVAGKRRLNKKCPDPAQLVDKDMVVNGEHFVLADSGSGSQRIILLGSASSVQRLLDAKVWFSDGTFRTAPAQWTQVYTIFAMVGTDVHPMLFALLRNKRTETYATMWRLIASFVYGSIDPSDCSCERVHHVDYELAAMSTAVAQFPGHDLRGSFSFQKGALFCGSASGPRGAVHARCRVPGCGEYAWRFGVLARVARHVCFQASGPGAFRTQRPSFATVLSKNLGRSTFTVGCLDQAHFQGAALESLRGLQEQPRFDDKRCRGAAPRLEQVFPFFDWSEKEETESAVVSSYAGKGVCSHGVEPRPP